MIIFPLGVPDLLPNFSILFTNCIPSTTFPKTVCLPFNQGVFTVVMKNCEPFVFTPEFAIERRPGADRE